MLIMDGENDRNNHEARVQEYNKRKERGNNDKRQWGVKLKCVIQSKTKYIL